jgi:type IV secretory pathway VirJ component
MGTMTRRLGLFAASAAMAAAAAAAAPRPSPLPVSTSRGEFQVLVYAPPGGPPARGSTRPLVLLISGEGGWREFDAVLAGWLSEAGYWVGGVNIKPYFEDAQDDRKALSADFRAYADALAGAAGAGREGGVVFVGFSFGADLAPWIAGAGGWEKRLLGLVMIAPDETGSLEYRLREMLHFSPTHHIFSVRDALDSAAAFPVLFLHGGADKVSAAPELAKRPGGVKKLVAVPDANHHFRGHEPELRATLLDGIEWIAKAERQAAARRPRP